MRVFLDTEFIEDGKTIEPISIGMIREDNEEYYAECSETDLSKANEFVLNNVLPNLKNAVNYGDVQESMGNELVIPRWDWDGEEFEFQRSKEDIREELLEFCGEKPEFWGYFCDYDWVLICQLFGRMIDLPKGWPFFCLDVKQEMYMNGFTKEKIEETYPQPTAHNSLDDARWIKLAHQYVVL